MKNELLNTDWYKALVEECKAIITEAIFTSRWALVEGYWELGKRLREETNIKWHAKGSESYLQQVADNLSISTRTLHYALQAYDKYPNLDKIPEGKNITWKKLITLYLPAPKTIQTPNLPKGAYDVIYADPPWKYRDECEDGAIQSGGATRHYPVMSIAELCELKIPSAENSVLFLWTTSPLLEDSFKVVNAWGFQYKSSFVWDKVKHNMGHYNSVRHEFLLICVKGSFTPKHPKLYDSVITEEKTEHSVKPEIVYEIIETLYPKGNYLELFARNKRTNWTSWGNEL